MTGARPRLRPNGKCAGCGEMFVDLDAFTMHAAGRLDAAINMKRRCRSPGEMKELGMGQRSNGAWTFSKRHHLPRIAAESWKGD